MTSTFLRAIIKIRPYKRISNETKSFTPSLSITNTVQIPTFLLVIKWTRWFPLLYTSSSTKFSNKLRHIFSTINMYTIKLLTLTTFILAT